MNNGQAFLFKHPIYGQLRVIDTVNGVFFCLQDLVAIIAIERSELFQILADSEGRVVEFSVMERIDKKSKKFTFLYDDQRDDEGNIIPKSTSKISRQMIFVDAQLVADMKMDNNPWMKFFHKWIKGFIMPVLQTPEARADYFCKQVGYAMYALYLRPIAIDLRNDGLYINNHYVD